MDPTSNLKQNQNGGYYENGKSLPMPVRIEIVQRHLEGQKVTSIARDLKLTHGVVSKIVRNFEKTGSWLPQNIRLPGDMNLPQLTMMPSTAADDSIPTPVPEPDVPMIDQVSTISTKSLEVQASNSDSPNPPTRPLPFSIEALLSKPTPSTTSSSSDSTTSDETSASTSSVPSPMPTLIDPIPTMSPATVGTFNLPRAPIGFNFFSQTALIQQNFAMPSMMPNPLMQTIPIIPPPQIQALQMQMSSWACNQRITAFQRLNGYF
uniref:Paired domain-containing protein n=1 Tax=Panagrellus redivivus TaxID=6233 RepID=A0A7E4UNA6_PANRE